MLEEIMRLRTDLKRGVFRFDDVQNAPLQKIVDYCVETGTKLSLVLEVLEKQVVDLMEIEEQKVKALATPIITLKILRVLPLISVFCGFIFGSDIIKTYLSIPGFCCIALGVTLYFIGQSVTKKYLDQYKTALDFDFEDDPVIILSVIKSSVLSGLSVVGCLRALGVEGSEQLEPGVPLAATSVPEYLSCLQETFYEGVSPVGMIDAKVYQLKFNRSSLAKRLGEELGVKLVIPISSCYLPSFILIGVVPVIIGMV
ncbi:MAG: hypothetical protein LBQ41_02540 [Candidatus Ancillula sp.]|jgi:tight adherence protein B|nr:hypothetical protein [Candidatus Ancillula sp.]